MTIVPSQPNYEPSAPDVVSASAPARHEALPPQASVVQIRPRNPYEGKELIDRELASRVSGEPVIHASFLDRLIMKVAGFFGIETALKKEIHQLNRAEATVQELNDSLQNEQKPTLESGTQKLREAIDLAPEKFKEHYQLILDQFQLSQAHTADDLKELAEGKKVGTSPNVKIIATLLNPDFKKLNEVEVARDNIRHLATANKIEGSIHAAIFSVRKGLFEHHAAVEQQRLAKIKADEDLALLKEKVISSFDNLTLAEIKEALKVAPELYFSKFMDKIIDGSLDLEKIDPKVLAVFDEFEVNLLRDAVSNGIHSKYGSNQASNKVDHKFLSKYGKFFPEILKHHETFSKDGGYYDELERRYVPITRVDRYSAWQRDSKFLSSNQIRQEALSSNPRLFRGLKEVASPEFVIPLGLLNIIDSYKSLADNDNQHLISLMGRRNAVLDYIAKNPHDTNGTKLIAVIDKLIGPIQSKLDQLEIEKQNKKNLEISAIKQSLQSELETFSKELSFVPAGKDITDEEYNVKRFPFDIVRFSQKVPVETVYTIIKHMNDLRKLTPYIKLENPKYALLLEMFNAYQAKKDPNFKDVNLVKRFVELFKP